MRTEKFVSTVTNKDDVGISFVESLKDSPRPLLARIDYQPEQQDQEQQQEEENQESESSSGGQDPGDQEGEGKPEESPGGSGEGEEDQDEGEDKDKSPSILVKEDLVLTSPRSHYCNLQGVYTEEDIERQIERYNENRQHFVRFFEELYDRFSCYGEDRAGRAIACLGVADYSNQGFELSNVLTRRDIESVIGGRISDVCSKGSKHEDAPEDIGFSLQLRSVMADNKFDRMLSGRRRGTLDGNMLYKVPAGDLKAFKNREARQNKDYHFTLLVDQSGSMEGRPCEQAADLGVSLYKAFDRAGIDYSCYGYSDRTARYKAFEDDLHPDALYSMLLHNSCDNNEYPALVDAFSRFPKASRSNNFVILLSDGGIHPGQKMKMAEFVKRNSRIATLIGIGVGSGRDPMPFCDVDIQRDTIPEAKMDLLRQLRNVIRRG